jgi:transcriptional regulator with XRE-family HTH domain
MKITITKGDNPVGRLFAETPSIESEAEYRKLMIVEELLTLMAEKGISRVELAKRMEVQPSRITAMMTGSNNFTIETLVRAGRAVGADIELHFGPVKDVAAKVSGKPRAVPRAVSKVAEETKPYRAKRKNEKA